MKAADFFKPCEFGVACPFGAAKIAYSLRSCIEKHWMDDDFGILKVNMRNAFKLAFRQAMLSECKKHFPVCSWGHGGIPFGSGGADCGCPTLSKTLELREQVLLVKEGLYGVQEHVHWCL
ncbi:hypothetical protein EMCRGX_G013364 [Ephydatia muelleri]